jgi:nitrite reductase/ring-hydroxylating ferredoxin subunit
MSAVDSSHTVRVCAVEELPPGDRLIVQVGRHSVGVFNVDGRDFAFRNRCPHAGAPLCLGRVTGMVEARGPGYDVAWIRDRELLRCPWHAWEFELETGRSVSNPRIRAKTYAVRVEDGHVTLELDTSKQPSNRRAE